MDMDVYIICDTAAMKLGLALVEAPFLLFSGIVSKACDGQSATLALRSDWNDIVSDLYMLRRPLSFVCGHMLDPVGGLFRTKMKPQVHRLWHARSVKTVMLLVSVNNRSFQLALGVVLLDEWSGQWSKNDMDDFRFLYFCRLLDVVHGVLLSCSNDDAQKTLTCLLVIIGIFF